MSETRDLPGELERRVMEIFDDPDDVRARRLEELYRDYPEHADRIRERLRATDDLARQFDAALSWSEGDGGRIGPYQVLKVLGEGGMGTVYLAEQHEPVRRQVALKVIKLGMDTRQVLARFEAERQALAIMAHPGIATVLDAGATPDGRPYFAMEYVPGVAITKFCDEQRLTVRSRLELFLAVCAAVQHAHQKGIIHRDLKPPNIMVRQEQGEPSPRIIDFGLARATDLRLTEQTLCTIDGAVVGTPEYMSPEQAGTSGGDVDTRTDIYSLGVVLYELLAGALPLESEELRRKGLDEMRRQIREDDPPRPSTRISALAESTSEVTSHRRTDVPSLVRALGGDLDWITMKALAKDRDRRYQTASELAADIERHLRDEPVLARPPSTIYRLRKLVARHRVSITAAVLVVLSLIGGVVATGVALVEARRQRQEARWQARIALQNEALATKRASSVERQRHETELREYASRIAAASGALRAGDSIAARSQIGRVPSHLRGWEWWHFAARLDTSERVLRGHTGAVRDICISPKGGFLASGGEDRRVILWNLETFEEITRWDRQPGWVVRVDVNAAGTKLLAVREGHSLAIWDVAARSISREWRVRALRFAALSPDGKVVAASTENGRILVWDVESTGAPRLLWTLAGHTESPELAFHPNGERLVSAGRDGTVRLWDIRTGRALRESEHASSRTGRERPAGLRGGRQPFVDFTPDGRRFVTASVGTWVVWDGTTGEELHRLHIPRSRGLGPAAWGVAISPDGQRVAMAVARGAVVWDVDTGQLVSRLFGHTQLEVQSVRFHPDGSFLLSGGKDAIRVWGRVPTPVRSLAGLPEWFGGLALSPDGSSLAETGDRRLSLWNVSGERQWSRPIPRRYHLLAYGEKTLIGADRHGRISGWRVSDGAALFEVDAHRKRVRNLHLSADGGSFFTLEDRGKEIRVSSTRDGSWIETIPLTAEVYDFAVSPDETRILAIDAGHTAGIWDRGTGQRLASLRGTRALGCLVFHPDGRRVATASRDWTIRIWNSTDGCELAVCRGHSARPLAAAFSPDGKRLASCSDDATIKLWDPDTGQEVATLYEHDERVADLAFSPDGRRLFSKDINGVIKIWDTESDPRIRAMPDAEAALARRMRAARLRSRALRAGWPERPVDLRRWLAAAEPLLEAEFPENLSDDRGALAAEAADVRRRLAWAERRDDLTLRHPAGRWTWAQAREVIRAADGRTASARYADAGPIDLRPQSGLVPIGMNPRTKLWEFYHLRSAADPLAVPRHHQETGEVPVSDATGIVFVLVPGGQELAPFFVARHEISRAQWRRLTGDDSSGDDAARPATSIDWTACDAILSRHGLALPTERQWEYACDRSRAFGIHHLEADVAEWCADWFSSLSLPVDPDTGLRRVPSAGTSARVVRGDDGASGRVGRHPQTSTDEIACRAVRALRHRDGR